MVVSSPQSSITWIVLLLAGPVLPSLLYVPVSSSSLTSGLCVCPSSSWVDRGAQSLTLAIAHLHYYCRLVSTQSPWRSRTLTWDMLVEQLHEGCGNASLPAVSPYLLEHKQFRKASHSSLVASKSVLNNNNNDVMSALAPPLASSANCHCSSAPLQEMRSLPNHKMFIFPNTTSEQHETASSSPTNTHFTAFGVKFNMRVYVCVE